MPLDVAGATLVGGSHAHRGWVYWLDRFVINGSARVVSTSYDSRVRIWTRSGWD